MKIKKDKKKEPWSAADEAMRRESAYANRGQVDESFEPVLLEPRTRTLEPPTLPEPESEPHIYDDEVWEGDQMLEEYAWWAFVKIFHEDHANAAFHCATVRYSPLTFRLAEALSPYRPQDPFVQQVLADKGQYTEDPGR